MKRNSKRNLLMILLVFALTITSIPFIGPAVKTEAAAAKISTGISASSKILTITNGARIYMHPNESIRFSVGSANKNKTIKWSTNQKDAVSFEKTDGYMIRITFLKAVSGMTISAKVGSKVYKVPVTVTKILSVPKDVTVVENEPDKSWYVTKDIITCTGWQKYKEKVPSIYWYDYGINDFCIAASIFVRKSEKKGVGLEATEPGIQHLKVILTTENKCKHVYEYNITVTPLPAKMKYLKKAYDKLVAWEKKNYQSFTEEEVTKKIEEFSHKKGYEQDSEKQPGGANCITFVSDLLSYIYSNGGATVDLSNMSLEQSKRVGFGDGIDNELSTAEYYWKYHSLEADRCSLDNWNPKTQKYICGPRTNECVANPTTYFENDFDRLRPGDVLIFPHHYAVVYKTGTDEFGDYIVMAEGNLGGKCSYTGVYHEEAFEEMQLKAVTRY